MIDEAQIKILKVQKLQQDTKQRLEENTPLQPDIPSKMIDLRLRLKQAFRAMIVFHRMCQFKTQEVKYAEVLTVGLIELLIKETIRLNRIQTARVNQPL